MDSSFFDIGTTPVHLMIPALKVQAVENFNNDYDGYVKRLCSPELPGALVAQFRSEASWGVWECHPTGDEVVLVLSGRAEFIQQLEHGEKRISLGAGQYLINPAGVPHTANVIEPFTALYITPAPGTVHIPRIQAAGD